MDGFTTTGVLLLLVIILTISWVKQGKKANLPPGPSPWPILGNLPQLHMSRAERNKKAAPFFTHLQATYGDIVTLYLGSRRLILLSNSKLLKEAFIDNGKYTDHRPVDFFAVKEMSGGKGVVMVNGPRQREIRKFTLSALRDFGVGKRSQEDKILEEMQYVLEEISSHGKVPFDPDTLLFKAVSNIVGNIIFGERNDYTDPHFKWLLVSIKTFFQQGHHFMLENFFPWVRFFRKCPILEERKKKARMVEKYIEGPIEEHRKSFNPENIRDFVDLYIRETTGNSTTSLEGPDLARMIFELYISGTDSTVTAIRWILIYLTTYAHVQDKCHQEIKANISLNLSPKLSDSEKLPYIGAVIRECMRIGHTAIATLLHLTTKDITLGGYEVPAGTLLIGNLKACHMDERVWSQPEEFRPERWLSPDGKLLTHPEFVPFSLGRRDCLGKKLANTVIFFFTTCLLQKFRFQWPEGESPPSLEGVQRLFFGPQPYRIVAYSLNE